MWIHRITGSLLGYIQTIAHFRAFGHNELILTGEYTMEPRNALQIGMECVTNWD